MYINRSTSLFKVRGTFTAQKSLARATNFSPVSPKDYIWISFTLVGKRLLADRQMADENLAACCQAPFRRPRSCLMELVTSVRCADFNWSALFQAITTSDKHKVLC